MWIWALTLDFQNYSRIRNKHSRLDTFFFARRSHGGAIKIILPFFEDYQSVVKFIKKSTGESKAAKTRNWTIIKITSSCAYDDWEWKGWSTVIRRRFWSHRPGERNTKTGALWLRFRLMISDRNFDRFFDKFKNLGKKDLFLQNLTNKKWLLFKSIFKNTFQFPSLSIFWVSAARKIAPFFVGTRSCFYDFTIHWFETRASFSILLTL